MTQKQLTSLDAMVEQVRTRHNPVSVVIAACAETNAVLAALEAARQGLATPLFVGDLERMVSLPELASIDFSPWECFHEPDPMQGVQLSLELLGQGRAQFLMKGAVKTDMLLRAVLGRKDREQGLLSHVGLFPHPREKRLLMITDAGVNIAPTLTRKIDIINNAVKVAVKLGISAPKVALLSATEKVSYNAMSSSKDADMLAKLARMDLFGPALVGGPFALDLAVSVEKARAKGVDHPVAGYADILCAPNIVVGNVLYKAVTSLMDLPIAGVVVGAKYPLVVPSRGDSDQSKFYALALAAYIAQV